MILDYNLGVKPVIQNFDIEGGRLYANTVDEYADVKAESFEIKNGRLLANEVQGE